VGKLDQVEHPAKVVAREHLVGQGQVVPAARVVRAGLPGPVGLPAQAAQQVRREPVVNLVAVGPVEKVAPAVPRDHPAAAGRPVVVGRLGRRARSTPGRVCGIAGLSTTRTTASTMLDLDT